MIDGGDDAGGHGCAVPNPTSDATEMEWDGGWPMGYMSKQPEFLERGGQLKGSGSRDACLHRSGPRRGRERESSRQI